MSVAFRLSVESIIFHDHKVLLVKRAPHCRVAPNVWNVPAGKVQPLETTSNAVIRETWEETGMEVKNIKLLAENAFEMKDGNERVFRNMFTYLVKPTEEKPNVILNDEHTEARWVTKQDLDSIDYSSLMPRLKQIILDFFDGPSCT